jgi:tetratricopeptide (TPR) repeat protein
LGTRIPNRQLINRFNPSAQDDWDNSSLAPVRPRWLSTTGYLMLSGVISLALFLVLWGILDDGETHAPWIPAGLVACSVMVVAIAAREIIMRRARTRYLLEKERIGYQEQQYKGTQTKKSPKTSISLERNAYLVNTLKKQARAAELPGTLPDEHLQVFYACRGYLDKVEHTLPTVSVGSPRMAALRNGQEKALSWQKYHLLQWAAKEAHNLMQEAKVRAVLEDKIEIAQRALAVFESALEYYPQESLLNDSIIAVQEFITTTKVSYYTELAERDAFKGHFQEAIDHYNDALFYLSREVVNETEKEILIKKINEKVKNLLENLHENQQNGTMQRYNDDVETGE